MNIEAEANAIKQFKLVSSNSSAFFHIDKDDEHDLLTVWFKQGVTIFYHDMIINDPFKLVIDNTDATLYTGTDEVLGISIENGYLILEEEFGYVQYSELDPEMILVLTYKEYPDFISSSVSYNAQDFPIYESSIKCNGGSYYTHVCAYIKPNTFIPSILYSSSGYSSPVSAAIDATSVIDRFKSSILSELSEGDRFVRDGIIYQLRKFKERGMEVFNEFYINNTDLEIKIYVCKSDHTFNMIDKVSKLDIEDGKEFPYNIKKTFRTLEEAESYEGLKTGDLIAIDNGEDTEYGMEEILSYTSLLTEDMKVYHSDWIVFYLNMQKNVAFVSNISAQVESEKEKENLILLLSKIAIGAYGINGVVPLLQVITKDDTRMIQSLMEESSIKEAGMDMVHAYNKLTDNIPFSRNILIQRVNVDGDSSIMEVTEETIDTSYNALTKLQDLYDEVFGHKKEDSVEEKAEEE